MDKILKPTRFEVDPESSSASKEWTHWLRTFEDFLEESEIVNDGKKLKEQCHLSPHRCMGGAHNAGLLPHRRVGSLNRSQRTVDKPPRNLEYNVTEDSVEDISMTPELYSEETISSEYDLLQPLDAQIYQGTSLDRLNAEVERIEQEIRENKELMSHLMYHEPPSSGSNNSSNKMEYGLYITQEYSVLKNIFSYLTAKDLKICARVCREWKKMADKFVQHTVECYHKPSHAEGWQDFNKLINPSLILYLEIVKYGGRVDFSVLRGLVSKTYDIQDIPFYRMITAHPIFTPCVRGKINTSTEAVDMEKGQTLVLFPQIPGLTIKKFEFDKKSTVKPDQVEPLLSAKGVILLAETSSPCVSASNKIVHYLYFTGSRKREVRSERPCLAGGLLAKACRVDNEGKTIPSPVVALTFEGDNVTVHSDINRTFDFETFFKRLSENAGQKPDGAERFAFIFNCIGRYENECDELALFRKHFPGVPYFGFWSYGEFCIPDSHARNMMDPKKIKIDRHIRYLNSACASYMIVTVTP